MIVRILFLLLSLASVYTQNEPSCSGQTCTVATPVTLSKETTWTGDGEELVISGAITCSDENTKTDCSLKALNYKSVKIDAAVDVARLEIEASSQISVNKDVTVMRGGSDPSPKTGGAAHGGDGSGVTTDSPGNQGYGNAIVVNTAGKRGGGTDDALGGNGGGFIRLVAPTVTLAAKLIADGDSATTMNRGGGSGGGVFVRATSSLDFGLGAAVSAKGAGGPGGAGGGGRVALIYGNSTTLRVEAVDVSGGPAMTNQKNGGSGTVYIRGGTTDQLIVKAAALDALTTEFTSIILEDEPVGDISLNNVVVRGEDVDNDAVKWLINGTLSLTSAKIIATTVDVEAGGGLIIDELSSIDVSKRVTDMKSPGAGVNTTEASSGGSHAGVGGKGSAKDAAEPHGTASQPLSLGGPGGGGAAGGGAVRIVVDGAVMIDGAVNADGESVTEGNGGGGAGGSIWISAGETFAGKGLLSASGGTSSGGGGGGGGRVRVEREQNAVKELAMRPPVPSTGIIDYTAPPPPAPLKTLLPAMLQWNVDGGVGVNIVGNDTTDGDLSTEATVRGGSGTMAAALGLQGTRLLIESDKPKQMPTLFGPGDASFGYVELIQVTLQTGAGGALAVGGAMLLDRVELRDDTEISLSGAHLRMQRTTIVAPIVKIAATSLFVASDATLQTLPSDKCPVGASTNGADGVRAGGGGARGGVGDDAGERDAGSNSRIPSGGSADSASNVVDVIRPALCGGRGGSVGPMVNKTRNIVAKGGLGGGVVSIDLLGDLQFEGKIIANGSPPDEHEEEDVAPGSGAGGSVYVRARRVLGAGSIEANGAAAVGAGGAGGGGRVAFAYVSEVSGNLTVSIKGGAPGTGSAVVPRAGGMGTLARIQELLATGSPAVERRFPTLLIAGGGSGVPSTTSVQPTYVPAQPTGDASVLKTINDERWTKITIRNAVAALPDKEPGVDTEQFEMISSVVKQQQVYVTLSKLATIDSMSLIDVSASVETTANNIGNAVGAGYGGNGAGPLNSTAVQYGYGSVTPGVGRAGGDHVTNGTTDVRGGYGGGAVHLLGKEQAVWTINGKITADGEKAQFGKQKASGGGSGGGVLIAGLVINGTGTVSADGGSGFQSGGAGGGGRLALHNYSSVDSALKLSVAPGAAVTGGMQAGYGTVYRVPLGTPEDEGTLELVGPAEGTVLTSRYNKAAGTSWPVNGVAKANVVVKRTFIDGRANGNFALTTSGNVTLDNGIIEASVIAINAHSLILSGNALVSTTALGTKTADKVANTNLTFSYVFGGGGGSHAGYGISPTSGTEVTGHTVSQPYPDILVIGADNKAAKDNGNFRQPNTFGLAGGLAHPPNNIAEYPETEPQFGGASGGIIKIVLKGKLSVGAAASIDADGGQPSVSKTRACSLGPYDPDPAKCGQMRDVALVGGGAGSGGSVWIEADVIEGEGIISANGGSTTPTKGRATTDKLAVTSPGGAGGGGRLAIYYNTLARDKLKLQAMGGRSLEGTAYGTAGTIYLSSTQTYTEELRFDNAHSRLVVTWPGSPLPEAKAAAPLQRLVVTGSANVWIPAVGNAFTSVVVGELTVESKSKIGGKRVILLSEVIKVRDGSQLFGSDLRVSALTVEIDGKTSLITATAAGLAPAAQNGADAAGVEGGGGGGGATGAGATCGSQAGGVAAAKPAMDPVPYLHGGNGGAASSLSGGRGGGVVSLDVYGKLTMKDGGGVTADGNPGGASATTQQGGGGGGGGTVEIIINAPIEGMGVLLARGGDGPATGGDGGGGVVRIVHPTFSDVNDLSNVQMDADPQGSNDGCLSEKGAVVFVASRENRRRFVCGGGRYDTNSTMPPYTCEQCAKGTAAPRVGTFECGVCPPGTFAKELGTVACIPCFAGSFSNTNRTVECTPCEAGEEQPARGKQSCADCKVGTAAPSPGTAECGACAPGLYQDETGQETCKQCEIGFSTLGKSRATTCTRCDAGFEAPKKGHPTCDECGPGYFSELVDSVPSPVCQACSMGQFARFAGSDACELCPARTFSGTAGASECELCGVGEYVEAKGQAACVRCPVGTFADEVGTLRCQTCPPDTFQSEEGSTACEKCPAGTFTECANFVSDETCAAPCHWLASGAGGQCVTRECAVCVDASSPDCKRWDTFAPEYSIVTGEALTCGCVITGETYTVTMRAKTGLNETLSMGGLLGNITFGVTANTGRKRSILEAPITNSKDNGDGTYSFDFTIDEAGTYMLVLEYQGEPIADSPYTFDVTQAAFPTWAIVLIAVGAGCCCLGLIAAAVVLMRKKGMCEGGGGGGNYNTTEMSSGTFNKKKALTPELRSFEIQIQDLTFDKEIGRGAFGVVYKGTWRDSNVAIKQLLLEETSGAVFERELKTFQDEALTMSTMRPHVNVVLLLGITPAPNLCIVVEFCEGGSLYSKLRGNENMTGVDQIHYCKGVASGMSHLHAENIIHRDLAARNILLDGGNNAKVSDFGLSRRCFGEVENQTKSDVGPLKWMAPEAIKNRIYSQRSDVWSYGVTIWEIIAREDPYPDMDALQVASRVCFNGLRLEKPYSSPPILSEIMDMCFQTEAANRPNFRQICQKFAQAGL